MRVELAALQVSSSPNVKVYPCLAYDSTVQSGMGAGCFTKLSSAARLAAIPYIDPEGVTSESDDESDVEDEVYRLHYNQVRAMVVWCVGLR